MPEGASRLSARETVAGVTPKAVLFDCDGVLADTEMLVNRLVAMAVLDTSTFRLALGGFAATDTAID